MLFQCIYIRQVPWEVLKTAAFDLGFQHLPRDLANVNAWKTMFDPYIMWQTFDDIGEQITTSFLGILLKEKTNSVCAPLQPNQNITLNSCILQNPLTL